MAGLAAPLEIGGKQRWLRFDLNAMVLIRERTGLNLLNPDKNLEITPLVVRTLVWAGLVHEEPSLTETAVGGWIDFDNFLAVAEAVFAALPSSGKEQAVGEPNPTMAEPRSSNGKT